jgi:hypothetical protein
VRIRPLIATLLTTVVASTAMAASAAAPASAAPDSGKLTVYMSQTERNVLDLGATGITIGDVVSGSGNVSKTKGGATIGSFAYRSETVRVNIPGGIENRLSTIWFSLPGGSLMASTVINVPSGTRPVKSQDYVILGGTGKYAGAAGDMVFTPLSPDDYKVVFRFTD